ncbi:hypothetical protein CEXT_221771 [Caerostris extrusa]|uniref:Uncharacterized protein n=1 Tax=Caerostris extrusa TaxID=172846 RepID=A0AAV4M9A9_CAEEX|nr:hypothetical protein CEXT_221771 [Caerostris extrusa]
MVNCLRIRNQLQQWTSPTSFSSLKLSMSRQVPLFSSSVDTYKAANLFLIDCRISPDSIAFGGKWVPDYQRSYMATYAHCSSGKKGSSFFNFSKELFNELRKINLFLNHFSSSR